MKKFLAVATILAPSCVMAFAGWGPKSSSTALAASLTDQELNLKTIDILSLDSIRSTLIRQEETIIFALIERAQFRKNKIVIKSTITRKVREMPYFDVPAIRARWLTGTSAIATSISNNLSV